jgi:predicted acetyltransferase
MQPPRIEVRTIAEGEVEAWSAGVEVGFFRHPGMGQAEFRRPNLDLDRTWAAFDGARVVGTLRSFATELTVPGGGFLPASAITGVAVIATHRRRGIMRGMMEPDLAAAAQRQEAVALLIASEYPIYGRFGFGPATDHVTYDVDTRTARFVHPGSGSVEMVDGHTFRAEAPAVYERYRAATPGAIARGARRWDLLAGLIQAPARPEPERFLVLARDAEGHARGSLAYRVEGLNWDEPLPNGTLRVDDLVGEDAEAEARLWRYCTEMDWVRTVRAEARGPDERLPWMLDDGRAARQVHRSDMLWARLLDVPKALSCRAYLTEARLTLEVVDHLGYGAGRFTLDAGPGGATCAPTGEDPDLTVPVDVLGAAYLGGRSLEILREAGRLLEHRPGSARRADVVFRWPVAPACITWF